jgi:hypothetical protein
MKSLTSWSRAALGAVVMAAMATAAHAQAPAPVGLWITADGAERLTVVQTGACSLAGGQGRVISSGSCSWRASTTGGILTIMSSQNYRPAPIYYNVVWLNQTTITVDGDVFYKRG